MKKYTAEFIGTTLLVLFGCGTTVAAAALLGAMGMLAPAFSTLTVAAAFGLAVAVLTLSFGKISGGHLNPAVSVALWVRGKMSVKDLLGYIIAQFAGGIAGAALLTVIVGGRTSLAANGYDTLSTFGSSMWMVLLIEAIITFTLVWVFLSVRGEDEFNPSQAVYMGLATAAVYLFAYPFTGASANPARSLGPAIFQEGDALSQVWLFILAPVLGAAVAAVLHKILTEDIGKNRRKALAAPEEAEDDDEAEAEMQDEAAAENYDEAETETYDEAATEAETETGDEAETKN